MDPLFKSRTLLVMGCLFISSVAFAQTRFEVAPKLVDNPSGRVPLAAAIEFTASHDLDAELTVSDGEKRWQTTHAAKPSKDGTTQIPVLGMRPNRINQIILTLKQGSKEVHQQTFTHQTPPLPDDQLVQPTVDLVVSKPELMEPGVTFITIRRRTLGQGPFLTNPQRRWFGRWGKVLAIDNRGEVVWWFETDFRVAGIEQTLEGNLLVQRVTASTLEIDLLGNILAEYYAEKTVDKPTNPDAIKIQGVEVMHHQPHQMSTGDFLSFTAYATVFKDWYTSETDPDAPRADIPMVVDRLIQYDRSGEVKWTWDVLDHLDTDRLGYDTFWGFWNRRGFPGHKDWSHGNGLSYYAPDDAVLAAFRNLSATVMIDRKSGDIKWLLGRHDGWKGDIEEKLLTPVGDLMWPGYTHNPRMTDIGTVIMFDNRSHGGPLLAFEEKTPIPQRYSRAVEFKVDPEAMTVEQIWTSGDTPGDDPCYSDAMGDAYRLPETGNRLVVFAMCGNREPRLYARPGRTWNDYAFGGRVVEYAGDEVVFRADVYDSDDLFQWEVYGGFRKPWYY